MLDKYSSEEVDLVIERLANSRNGDGTLLGE